MKGLTGTKPETEDKNLKSGSANASTQNQKGDKDSHPKDEYYGQYRSACSSVSEDQKWGNNQNPVRHDGMPAKNLKSVGPS